MPVLFIGHGSPMNAIELNEFSQQWSILGKNLPQPSAILCISAHWETRGTQVTAMKRPDTIHDFGGFPQALFDVNYPANGSPELAAQIAHEFQNKKVGLNMDWGIDHGCWSILVHLYPEANIPVLQLSLDYSLGAAALFILADELAFLRNNWAIEMTDIIKNKILLEDYDALINYEKLSNASRLAIPTTDHYYPLLYALALRGNKDNVTFFNDKILGGSIGMTSLLIDSQQ